jgi:L-2-hydroxyglutarate oxidase LhgO
LGGAIELARPVTGIERRQDGLVLQTPRGPIQAGAVIACAGLWADRVAAMTGDRTQDSPAIVPFRGDYYTLSPDAATLVNGLIYPVPDPRFPFLGVHFTRRIDGQVWAGPNAVLAFRRTGYRRRDISVRDLAEAIGNPGFRKLARKFWRMGAAEMWRDFWKAAFVKEMQRYVPAVRADQVTFGPSGVRAQALSPDGTLVDDFDLAGGNRVLHVRNAPSPAATSSLAIGEKLAAEAISRFEL